MFKDKSTSFLKISACLLLASPLSITPLFASDSNTAAEEEVERNDSNNFIRIMIGDNQTLSSDKILDYAKVGKFEFITIVSEMERLATSYSYQKSVYDYLLILDELYAIGESYDMQTWGSNPVISLGRSLTKQAVKWINFSTDSEEIMQIFAIYAVDKDIREAVNNNLGYLELETKLDDLLYFNNRANIFIKLIGERNKRSDKTRWLDLQTFEEVENLQGEIIHRIMLLFPNISGDSIDAMIANITSHHAISKLCYYIEKNIYQNSQSSDLNDSVRWLTSLSKVIDQNKGKMSIDLISDFPSDLYIEILKRMITASYPLDEKLCLEFLPFLTVKKLTHFAGIFSELKWELVPRENVQVYLELCKVVLDKLREYNLRGDQDTLEKILSKMAVTRDLPQFEGLYQTEINHKKAFISILNFGGSDIGIGIRVEENPNRKLYQDFLFYNAVYNTNDEAYEVHRVVVPGFQNGLPLNKMTHFKFKFSPHKKSHSRPARLQGVFSQGTEKYHFTATQTARIKIFPNAKQVVSEFTGKFENEDVAIDISKTGNNYVATVFWKNTHVVTNFNYGYFDRSKQLLYLATGEHESSRLVHMRLFFSKKGSCWMQYFIGGEKEVPAVTHLVRNKK